MITILRVEFCEFLLSVIEFFAPKKDADGMLLRAVVQAYRKRKYEWWIDVLNGEPYGKLKRKGPA